MALFDMDCPVAKWKVFRWTRERRTSAMLLTIDLFQCIISYITSREKQRSKWHGNEMRWIEPVFALCFEYFSIGTATDHPALKIEHLLDRPSILILLSSKFKIHSLRQWFVNSSFPLIRVSKVNVRQMEAFSFLRRQIKERQWAVLPSSNCSISTRLTQRNVISRWKKWFFYGLLALHAHLTIVKQSTNDKQRHVSADWSRKPTMRMNDGQYYTSFICKHKRVITTSDSTCPRQQRKAFISFVTEYLILDSQKMGGRSINTTKSGKFMNPTDQARTCFCFFFFTDERSESFV